jgi:7,8-dihydropterin-6-yl-methyl-4-(beta-D-ribofuranosyl)aminobenzene 5'-phosphate synthase
MRAAWPRLWFALCAFGLSAAAGGGAAAADAGRWRLTVVFDNVAHRGGPTPGWGFSCLVEGAGATVLFDTGADGETLLANMRQLGHAPAALDAVVLSHIHADHTGGLEALLAARPGLDVWLPAAFPATFQRSVAARGARVHPVHAAGALFGPFLSTGPLDHGVTEQALIVDTAGGLVVITGCAHPGIVRIVEVAMQSTGRPVHLLMGGFHLMRADRGQIDGVIARLRALGVEKVAPSHCTGDVAIGRFRRAWGADFVDSGLGAVIEVPLR